MLFSLPVSDYFGSLHCFPEMLIPLQFFFFSSNFSVSEQNCRVDMHFLSKNVRDILVTRF